MNLYGILLQTKTTPEIPIEIFWATITTLIGIIVWVTIRYITKLDTLLERLDTAVDEIKLTLKVQSQRLDNQEIEIKGLKEANKAKRR